jgi:hypothetical protein
MTPPNVFPLYYSAVDMGSWVRNLDLANMIWLRIRKDVAPDVVWYAIDLAITSPYDLHLRVFGMECSVTGGIGELVFEHSVRVEELPDSEQMLFCQLVLNEYTAYAERELEKREDAERRAKIEALRKELFGC